MQPLSYKMVSENMPKNVTNIFNLCEMIQVIEYVSQKVRKE